MIVIQCTRTPAGGVPFPVLCDGDTATVQHQVAGIAKKGWRLLGFVSPWDTYVPLSILVPSDWSKLGDWQASFISPDHVIHLSPTIEYTHNRYQKGMN